MPRLTRSELGTPECEESWATLEKSDDQSVDEPVRYTAEELRAKARPPGLPQLPKPILAESESMASGEQLLAAPIQNGSESIAEEQLLAVPIQNGSESIAEEEQLLLRTQVEELQELVWRRDQEINKLETQLREQHPQVTESMEQQRWEFLFAQANGDRMVLNDQLDQLQSRNDQLTQHNSELEALLASAQERITSLLDHTTNLQARLDAALSPEDASVLREATNQIETRLVRTQRELSGTKKQLDEATRVSGRDALASKQAELECAELRVLTQQLQDSLCAQQECSASTNTIKMLNKRTRNAEELAHKLQDENERLSTILGSTSANAVDESRVMKDNSFLLKRVSFLEAELRRCNTHNQTTELSKSQEVEQLLQDLRIEVLAGLSDRITRCEEIRASEFIACVQCGYTRVAPSTQQNALREVMQFVSSCFASVPNDQNCLDPKPEDPLHTQFEKRSSADQKAGAVLHEIGQHTEPAGEESFVDRVHRDFGSKHPGDRRTGPSEIGPSSVQGSRWAPASCSADVKKLKTSKTSKANKSSNRRRQVAEIAEAQSQNS